MGCDNALRAAKQIDRICIPDKDNRCSVNSNGLLQYSVEDL